MDDDNILFAGEVFPIVPIGVSETLRKGSAMTPEHHRTFAVIGSPLNLAARPFLKAICALAARFFALIRPSSLEFHLKLPQDRFQPAILLNSPGVLQNLQPQAQQPAMALVDLACPPGHVIAARLAAGGGDPHVMELDQVGDDLPDPARPG